MTGKRKQTKGWGFDKVEFEVKDLEVFIQHFAHPIWSSLKQGKTDVKWNTRFGEFGEKQA